MANEKESIQCPPGTLGWWAELAFKSIQKFGIATVLLLGGCYYLATHVVDPLVVSYGKFVDAQTTAAKQQAEAIRGLETTQREMSQSLHQTLADHEKIMSELHSKRGS